MVEITRLERSQTSYQELSSLKVVYVIRKATCNFKMAALFPAQLQIQNFANTLLPNGVYASIMYVQCDSGFKWKCGAFFAFTDVYKCPMHPNIDAHSSVVSSSSVCCFVSFLFLLHKSQNNAGKYIIINTINNGVGKQSLWVHNL